MDALEPHNLCVWDSFLLILGKRRESSRGHAETAGAVSEKPRGRARPAGHALRTVESQLRGRLRLLGPTGGSTALKSEDQVFSHLNPTLLPPFSSGCSALECGRQVGREKVCGSATPGPVVSSDFRPTWENFT